MNIITHATTALLVALSTGLAAAPAAAAPIVSGSTLNFGGQSTCDATRCTFGSAIVTGGSGSFAAFAFGTPAAFSTLTFDPFTAQQVYTTTNALAQTASFETTAQLQRSVQTTGGLTTFTITDLGVARLTGFDPTPGTFLFTANQNGTLQGSFSSTTAVLGGAAAAGAVPEPGVWAMLLLGVGLVGARLRRRKALAFA